MNRTQLLARCAAAAAAATIIAGLAASPAAARPDQGDPIPDRFSSHLHAQPCRHTAGQVRQPHRRRHPSPRLGA